MRSVILLFALTFIQALSLCQVNDSSSAQDYMKKADSLMTAKSLDSASYYLDLSARAFWKSGDTLGYLHSRNKKSVVAYDQVNYDSSELIAKMALSQMKNIRFENLIMEAEFYRRIGVVHEVRDGDFKKAISFYNKGLMALDNHPERAFLEVQLQKDVAIGLLSLGLLDSATNSLKRTISFQEKHFTDTYAELADTYRLIAISYSLTEEKKSAIEHYRYALRLLRKEEQTPRNQLSLADVLGNMAASFQTEGYYDSALYYYYNQKTINERILDKNHRNLSYLYGNLTTIHAVKGNHDSSAYYAEKSLKSRQETLAEDHPDLADSYTKLSTVLIESNRLEEAEIYSEKALEILQRSFGNNHLRTYSQLSILGRIYFLKGDYDKSLKYYQQAIKSHGEGEFDMGQSIIMDHLSVADNYFNMEDLSFAMSASETAYSISLDLFDSNHETIARARLRKGEFHLLNGNLRQAAFEFEEAHRIFLENHGARHPKVAEAIAQLARVRFKEMKFEESLDLLQKALQANSYNFQAETNGSPALDDMISPIDGIADVVESARVMYAQYQKTGNSNSLHSSYSLYTTAVDLLAELVFETAIESDATRIMGLFHESYSELLTILLEMHQQGLMDKQLFVEEVLKYSEESRGIGIIFNRFKNKSRQVREKPSAMMDSLRFINREISFVKSELLTLKKEGTDSVKTKYYSDLLFNLTNTKNRFESESNTRSQAYADFKSDNLSEKLKYYQKRLNSDEAIIEYFMAKSTLFTIVITKSSVEVLNQNLTDEFDSQLASYLSLKSGDMSEYRAGAHALYKSLILPATPLLTNIKRLIILPEKDIWNVKFALLLTDSSEDTDLKSLDYLLRQYQISYAYSLNILFEEKPSKKESNGEMLAFAFGEEEQQVASIFSFRADDKTKIQGTASEVKNFHRAFKGDFLYGSQASEKAFKNKAGPYAILHLALHGEVDDSDMNASHLIFNQSDKDSEEDGRLYPFELYNLELNADMAVLSACHTGAGKIVSGEGVMSIGRGFHYAGVNSLLLSQWEVSDAIAPIIIKSFYEHLKDGKNKDEALRLAQLGFLEQANNVSANPYFWGSFFILGDTSSIDLKRPFRWKVWLGLALLLILVVMTASRRTGKSTD